MRAATASLLLAVACCAPPSTAAPRDLGRLRHERLPERLPAAWTASLERAAAALPARALDDPDAVVLVRDCLLREAWVDPSSVRVAPDLPRGIRASYRPRTPRLLLVRGAEPLALLAADGVVLPPGFDAAPLDSFLAVPLEAGEPPAAGTRLADPLVQEALAAAVEAQWVRDALGIPVVRIQRRHGVPVSVRGVAPELSFVCADGREICWGWSVASAEAIAAPPEVQIPLERKGVRLRAVAAAWPRLEGLSRVELDRPTLRLFGASGAPVPAPPGL